jgi:hypothetical protein
MTHISCKLKRLREYGLDSSGLEQVPLDSDDEHGNGTSNPTNNREVLE